MFQNDAAAIRDRVLRVANSGLGIGAWYYAIIATADATAINRCGIALVITNRFADCSIIRVIPEVVPQCSVWNAWVVLFRHKVLLQQTVR
ncbi:MAG: hypothetical protein HYX63_01715 [Gammaproteobacteria bacterium]|nr:hypothetical protein [Gammaproteobacteria bacterium]